MKADFKLVGLSRPGSATLEFLHTDKETFWAKSDLPQDRFDALFTLRKDHGWADNMIAHVECDYLNADGIPINARLVGVSYDGSFLR